MCVCVCVQETSPFVMVVYEGGHGADLDGVGVVGRVLKQTIIRVEQLPGNQEEELPGRPAVVQPATQAQIYHYYMLLSIFPSKTFFV